MSESFAAQLRRVREAQGMSRNKLSRATERPEDPGVSEAAIVQLEREPERVPQDATIRRLGRALGASGEDFPAWALAEARGLFDERVVGEAAALQMLDYLLAAGSINSIDLASLLGLRARSDDPGSAAEREPSAPAEPGPDR